MKSVRLVSALMILALLLALVPASMAQEGMFGLTGEDLAALAAANGASAGAASAAYDFVLTLTADAGSQGAVDMNLNGSGNYDTTSGGFSLVVSGSMTADGQETPVEMEVLVVENTVYLYVPGLLGPQWLSVSPEEMETFGESFAEQLPVDPTSLAGGDAAASEGLMEALNNLATLNPEDYISATRDGNHFTFNADVAGLLGSEQFVQFIVAASEANAEATGMDTAELETQLGQVSTALQGSTFQLEQYLTDDAMMIGRTVLSSSFTIDPASLGETGDAVAFDFVFDINLSGYNEAYTFEAPADAMPLSQMMGGSM